MTYVALLRGINVGGNRTVDMKSLKAVFERAGMQSVRTYINSGNVVFTSASRSRARLAAALEREIEAGFGFPVAVLVLDEAAMRAIDEAIPSRWVNDTTMRCDVLFLWDDVDRPSIVAELPHKPGLEDVRYVPGAVIWRIDRANVTRSGLPKIVGTPLYKRMTIRNVNTTRRLAQLMTKE